jgi:hypothetical protein
VSGVVSGTLTGAGPGYYVTLTITSPVGNVVFSDSVVVAAKGAFSDTFYAGVTNLWTSGTYTVKVSYGSLSATSTFSYAPITTVSVTATSTVVSTLISTTTSVSPTTITVSGQGSTVTQTQTQTQTTTVTQSASGLPAWGYAALVVLLLVGLAVGYVARNMIGNRSAAR